VRSRSDRHPVKSTRVFCRTEGKRESKEKTALSMSFMMHGDMGGKHNFRVHVPTNDPSQPDKTMKVLSNWVR